VARRDPPITRSLQPDFEAYGFDDEAAPVASGIFVPASRFISEHLPELFAGLTRHP
jgi:hypothetical protein